MLCLSARGSDYMAGRGLGCATLGRLLIAHINHRALHNSQTLDSYDERDITLSLYLLMYKPDADRIQSGQSDISTDPA